MISRYKYKSITPKDYKKINEALSKLYGDNEKILENERKPFDFQRFSIAPCLTQGNPSKASGEL